MNLSKKNYGFLAGLVICLLLALIYWSGLSGGFFFDDSANILESEALKLKSFSVESLSDVLESGIAGPLGRPVSMLSFATNYFFSEFDPFAFKLTNLIIHCVNSCLVFVLSLLLIRATDLPSRTTVTTYGFATIISALWSLHPIQITSVLYVVQRMTSLSSLFVLIGLLLHIWARQRGAYHRTEVACLSSAWFLLLPLAMFSKETGVLFVPYVAVYEAILHRRITNGLDNFAKMFFGLLGLACAGLLIYLCFTPAASLLQSYHTRAFSLSERVMTETRIVWAYSKMIIAPTLSDFGLYHDDIKVSTSLLAPVHTIFSILALASTVILAWFVRNRAPLVSFAVLWFLAGHSLESTIFPLELMHEHRNYLPSIGLLVLIALPLASTQMANSTYRLLVSSAVVAILLYFTLLTHLRSDMYGNDYLRTQVEAGYRPDSVRSQYEAGAMMANIYHRNRQPILAGFARKHFEHASLLDPTFKLALVGMLQLDCLAAPPSILEEANELARRLANGNWNQSDRVVMHALAEMSNEGKLCLERRQMDNLFGAALRNLSTTAEDRAAVLSDYALYLWLGQKDYISAREILTRAVTANANDVLNRLNLLQLERFLGNRAGTLEIYKDLSKRPLKRRDHLFLQRVRDELASEGIQVQ